MTEDEKSVGELLRKFTPRPAPPELKRRILAAAGERDDRGRFFSRAQWRAAAVFSSLILASAAWDALSVGRSARGASALLAGPANSDAATQQLDQELIREVAGQDRSLENQIRVRLTAENTLGRPIRPVFGGGSGEIGEGKDVR